jgi:hypothetical protein
MFSVDRKYLACLFSFLCGGVSVWGGPILVGYTNCLAVTNYPQSLMDQIGQLKWYFTHASVGENMLDGIAVLHARNPAYYRLQSIPATDIPPGATEPGVVYEYDRGNPAWWQKFDQFQTCVSNGWRFPVVNVAMTKLCFIDSGAMWDWSVDYIGSLESAFPETLFVHTTIPLCVQQDGQNYDRNCYNDALRDWCRTNNRVLFDIADIESHDSNGVPVVYTLEDRVCQRLNEDYAIDEGHLNAAGSELVAKGFYALAGALMSIDRDGDGMCDGQELVAGTLPGNRGSVFKLTGLAATPGGAVIVKWNSISNRFYTLQRCTDPGMVANFTNVLLDAAATPPLNVYTDSPPANRVSLYRVLVRQ